MQPGSTFERTPLKILCNELPPGSYPPSCAGLFWQFFLIGTCIGLNVYKQDPKEKEKLQRSSKLPFIFLEDFSDPFVTVVEAASQSSPGTRAKLHKVEAAEEVSHLILQGKPNASYMCARIKLHTHDRQ
jgi:hypothetical protein